MPLLAAAADDRLYAVYVLALVLGMRRGEILGLRWSAVDLARATLRVQASLQRVGGQLVLTSPKTKRSRRAIPLPQAVVKVLEAHRHAQAVERSGAELWADDDLVFTTSIGTAIEPRTSVATSRRCGTGQRCGGSGSTICGTAAPRCCSSLECRCGW
jgi:integrase